MQVFKKMFTLQLLYSQHLLFKFKSHYFNKRSTNRFIQIFPFVLILVLIITPVHSLPAKVYLYQGSHRSEVFGRNCPSGVYLKEPSPFTCICVRGVWGIYKGYCSKPLTIAGGDHTCFKMNNESLTLLTPFGNPEHPFEGTLTAMNKDFTLTQAWYRSNTQGVWLSPGTSFIMITNMAWTIYGDTGEAVCLQPSTSQGQGALGLRVYCVFNKAHPCRKAWTCIKEVKRGCLTKNIQKADSCAEILPPKDDRECEIGKSVLHTTTTTTLPPKKKKIKARRAKTTKGKYEMDTDENDVEEEESSESEESDEGNSKEQGEDETNKDSSGEEGSGQDTSTSEEDEKGRKGSHPQEGSSESEESEESPKISISPSSLNYTSSSPLTTLFVPSSDWVCMQPLNQTILYRNNEKVLLIPVVSNNNDKKKKNPNLKHATDNDKNEFVILKLRKDSLNLSKHSNRSKPTKFKVSVLNLNDWTRNTKNKNRSSADSNSNENSSDEDEEEWIPLPSDFIHPTSTEPYPDDDGENELFPTTESYQNDPFCTAKREAGLTREKVKKYWTLPENNQCARSLNEAVYTDQLRRFTVQQFSKVFDARLRSLNQMEQLLNLTKNVMLKTCSATYVPQQYFQVAYEAFVTFVKEDFFYGIEEEADPEIYERIVETLRKCAVRGKPHVFEHKVQSCGFKKITGHQIFPKKRILLQISETNSHKNHEILIEIAWKMFLNAHSYCFKDFKFSNDHHLYSILIMKLFTNSIYEKWIEPLASSELYSLILPKLDLLDKIMDNIDYCVAGTGQVSNCPVWLDRTSTESPEKELNKSRRKRSLNHNNQEMMENTDSKRRKRRSTIKGFPDVSVCLKETKDLQDKLGLDQCVDESKLLF